MAERACCVCMYVVTSKECGHSGYHFYCDDHDSMAAVRTHIDVIKQRQAAEMEATVAAAEQNMPRVPVADIRSAASLRGDLSVRRPDGSTV